MRVRVAGRDTTKATNDASRTAFGHPGIVGRLHRRECRQWWSRSAGSDRGTSLDDAKPAENGFPGVTHSIGNYALDSIIFLGLNSTMRWIVRLDAAFDPEDDDDPEGANG